MNSIHETTWMVGLIATVVLGIANANADCGRIEPRPGNVSYYDQAFATARFTVPTPVDPTSGSVSIDLSTSPVSEGMDPSSAAPAQPSPVAAPVHSSPDPELSHALAAVAQPEVVPAVYQQVAVAQPLSREPLPPESGAPYRLYRGETLKRALERWARSGERELLWMAAINYRIAASAEFGSTLSDAVERINEHFACGAVSRPLRMAVFDNAVHIIEDTDCHG